MLHAWVYHQPGKRQQSPLPPDRADSEVWTVDVCELYIRIVTETILLTASTGGYCRLFRAVCPALRNQYVFLNQNVFTFSL